MAHHVTRDVLWLMLPIVLLALMPPLSRSADELGPGCHLYSINLTLRSDKKGTCQGARMVYACVGYCDSSAFPSSYSVLLASDFTRNFTSVSRCCTISKAVKVKVQLECPEVYYYDNIEILTAQACRCHVCHKARY